MDEKIAHRNKRICVAIEFMRAIFLGSSVMNTYYTDVYGLTQLQVFWLQVCLNVVLVASDIPLGHLADRFGIRRMIAAGVIMQLLQSVYFAYSQSFWQFAFATSFTGLYISALSNTSSSLMTASVDYIVDSEERDAEYSAYESAVAIARVSGLCTSMLLGAVIVNCWGASCSVLFAADCPYGSVRAGVVPAETAV